MTRSGSRVHAASPPLTAAAGPWPTTIRDFAAPVAAATAVAIAAGWMSSLAMPRGPVTALHGVGVIGLGLLIGAVSGALMNEVIVPATYRVTD